MKILCIKNDSQNTKYHVRKRFTLCKISYERKDSHYVKYHREEKIQYHENIIRIKRFM